MKSLCHRALLPVLILIASVPALADNATPLISTEGLRKINLTATAGDQFNQFEGCQNLFDHDINTKWCRDGFSFLSSGVLGDYVEFNSATPFVPKGYTLVTANDNSRYTGRNPITWKLKAKNTGDTDWTTIVDVKDDHTMKDEDFTSYNFAIPSTVTTAYQFYRFEITGIDDGNIMQLSEMNLWKAIDSNDKTYAINLPKVEHGTLSATIDGSVVTNAYEGDLVHVEVKWDDDYELVDGTLSIMDAENNSLSSKSNYDLNSEIFTFVMPASAVTVNAVIKKKQYWINVPYISNMFNIVASPESAESGQTVTLTVNKGKGVVMDELIAFYKKYTNGGDYKNVRRRDGGNHEDERYLEYIKLTKVDDTHYIFTMPKDYVSVDAKVHYEGKYALNRAEGIPTETVQFKINNIEAKSANEGDEVDLFFNTYIIDNISVTGNSGAVAIEDHHFTMPAEDINISFDSKYQLWHSSAQWYYSLDVIVDGENAEGNEVIIAPGKTVTIKAKTTNSDMILSMLYLRGSSGLDKYLNPSDIVETSEEGYPHVYTYTFTMPYTHLDLQVEFGNPITVHFLPNGGSGDMDDITIGSNGSIYLPECGFTAPDGYDFAGWECDSYNELMAPGKVVHLGWENTTIQPHWKENVLELLNADDNTSAIKEAAESGKIYNRVTLIDRTFYKDGDWNTICLPFDVSIANSPLADAKVMKLNGTESYLTDGKLTLTFEEENSTMTAGTPYLIKWDKADDYDTADSETRDLKAPEFCGMTISDKMNDVVTNDNLVTFKGSYSYLLNEKEDKSILFMGDNNRLYYPQPGLDDAPKIKNPGIGAFRCYFKINDNDSKVKEFNLSFGEDEETSLTAAFFQREGEQAVYDLSGRKVNSRLPKGIYIINGKKVTK